jgi:hypothetical protein
MAEGGIGKVFGFAAMLIVSALLGSLLGELLGVLFSAGTLHDICVKGYDLQFGPLPINLKVLTFNFAMGIKLNLCSFLGIAAGLMFFRK